MHKHVYAFIVRNDQGTWDVWSVFGEIPDRFASRRERVENALASGLPIISRNLTEYGLLVRSGSVWNGTEWTGGDPDNRKEGNDDGLFSYICEDTIILIIAIPKAKQPNYDIATAVFNSENTMIKIPDGEVVKSGDIWDGEKFIPTV